MPLPVTSRPAASTTTPAAPVQATRSALVGALDFNKVTTATVAFLDQAERDNRAAIARDGVGLRYGEKSPFAKLSPAERFSFVQNIVKQKNPAKANDRAYINSLIARMKPTSCIGYTMEALKAGYAAAGQSARWNEIAAAVRAKGVIGTVLCAELQKDGWESVYWNADTSTYRGPMETAKDKQRAQDHAFFKSKFIAADGSFKPGVDAAGKPIAGRDYYGTYPQRALVNFFAGKPGVAPSRNREAMAHLEKVPLFIGVAASGYHTFPGQGVKVRDSHVARNPDDRTNIENRPFEELDLAWDSASRSYKTDASGKPVYSEEQSGVMLIPPGTWTN